MNIAKTNQCSNQVKFELIGITLLTTTSKQTLTYSEIKQLCFRRDVYEKRLDLVDKTVKKDQYLNDMFVNGTIYAAIKSAIQKCSSKSLHCFYFGHKYGYDRSQRVKAYVSNMEIYGQLRNFSMEKILYAAKVVHELDKVTLTTVTLAKDSLVTKEATKQIYQNPKDSSLKSNRDTQILSQPFLIFDEKYAPYWHRTTIQAHEKHLARIRAEGSSSLDESFCDDLENLNEAMKNLDFPQPQKLDQYKRIFFFTKLSSLELQSVELKDQNFLNTLRSYCMDSRNYELDCPDYDVSIQEMIKSNSKSKYAFWKGSRTTVMIPSDDYPYITDINENFVLPVSDFIFYPGSGLILPDIDEILLINGDLEYTLAYLDVWRQEHFVHELTSRDLINYWHEMSVKYGPKEQQFYCRVIPSFDQMISNGTRYLKEGGEIAVFMNENYPEECDFYTFLNDIEMVTETSWIACENCIDVIYDLSRVFDPCNTRAVMARVLLENQKSECLQWILPIEKQKIASAFRIDYFIAFKYPRMNLNEILNKILN